MQYEEYYLVTVVKQGGRVISDRYDAVTEAVGAYDTEQRNCQPGERVELRRYTSVVLATRARA
ncbi:MULTISPECIES: hypothetical protein [unclassified Streptomyces]|uniref:hypothetical protein n=1 Tax=unclassified Streptomyces TaxID=2593676 RepID=UPI0033CB8A06